MDNDVKQILKQIIVSHGTLMYKKPNQLKSLLKDYCNGEFKKEIMALMLVVEEGMVEEIIISKDKNIINRQVKYLCDSTPINEEIAEWAIEAWYYSLEIVDDCAKIDGHEDNELLGYNVKKTINNECTNYTPYKKEHNQERSLSPNNTEILELKTYCANEIRVFKDAAFVILDKYISHSGKVVFDIFVNDFISVGSSILISNTEKAYLTKIVSIDSPAGNYTILKDGAIQIISKGVPLCRELFDFARRNEIFSVVVQGVIEDYTFIKPMKLAKGNTMML